MSTALSTLGFGVVMLTAACWLRRRNRRLLGEMIARGKPTHGGKEGRMEH